MNAVAQALPSPQIAPGKLPKPGPSTPVAGLTLTAGNCVAMTAALLQAACQRGQFDDAGAAARIALPLAQPRSPHSAMLHALATARPLLMIAPGEQRLYLLRDAKGRALGLLRLRDNGRIGSPDAELSAHHAIWRLQDGCLLLAGADGAAHTRFALCAEQADPASTPATQDKPASSPGQRLYLGQSLIDGAPRVLQEFNCTYTRLRLLDTELAGPFCGLFNVEAMVPAALPERAVLLLAAPHNGASALAGRLNQHAGQHIDGELLGAQGIGLAEGTLALRASGVLGMLRTLDPVWFACMMMGRSHDSTGRDLTAVAVRGFTLASAHPPAVLDWAMAQTGLRIVHIARSNLLAEFADLQAEQHGALPSVPLHFDGERFTRFVEMKRFYLAALRQRLVQRNADTVEVDASRLNAATLAELRGFLSDAAMPPAQAEESIRLSHGPVIARFENPGAVLACLAKLGQPHWADLEGVLPALD